ncbi:Uncharacterized [Syntrophomonas zehnderi OL-4]|uniref:Uncharacterized n=1 Tax=Syntrophomonas zehnderi OL-4 TaxID=690567 RepID=A0A0E4C7W1_9FIRM|nr:hypothetical protein [Syntrophomonas zehnderi]CFX15625.1 Uncharacterized [Syntrophomonas zehnderi OL-4]
MKIQPIFYEHPDLYGKYYAIGLNASIMLGRAVELLAEIIPEYTHQDVYRFLTDQQFRHAIINSKQNRLEHDNTREAWLNLHEREIGKRKWYQESVDIVRHLIDAPEPPSIYENTMEGFVYDAVTSSQQQMIPVSYRWLSSGQQPGALLKQELLLLFEVLGMELESINDEIYYVGFINTFSGSYRVPTVTVTLPGLSFLDKETQVGINAIGFHLPDNEFKQLRDQCLAGSSDRPTR